MRLAVIVTDKIKVNQEVIWRPTCRRPYAEGSEDHGRDKFREDRETENMKKMYRHFFQAPLNDVFASYSPDANSLEQSFWVHVENRAYTVCHPNITVLKDSVNQDLNAMFPEFIRNTCKTFKMSLEVIINAERG
ncbi:Uncharacterized protein FKW44_007421 [Caligus rogercresseyi]|uniref:Uncharacterized protein n=1 Tax=Caligus rogercresseyi TaxID=217165 RepID=A0A7T8KEQ3_CALRO|nr:Uncharacterized protein FKW44_007421 [Caligus rogercresseyi]